MQTNTLVTHKKLRTLGIGCISKVLAKKVRVNFGIDDTIACAPSELAIVDISKCKTIPFSKYQSRVLNERSKLEYAIVGNELMHFVGIGWISERVITHGDLKLYPRVV